MLYIEGKQVYNTYTNSDGQEVTFGNVVMDRFGSVCKIMERKEAEQYLNAGGF